VLDLLSEKYHTIQLSHKQFQKLFKICDNEYEKVMKLIDFKLDRIIIKHIDVLMNFERYMPEKSQQLRQDYVDTKQPKPAVYGSRSTFSLSKMSSSP